MYRDIDWNIINLILNFEWMSFQKLLLQEGEKFVLLITNTSLSNQGVFSVVTNLGLSYAIIIIK